MSVRFVGLTGTAMSKSITDFAHLLRWSLGPDNAPVPKTNDELDDWARALDEKVDEFSRNEPGALLALATPEERATLTPMTAARRGFQRRLNETPGVIATTTNAEHVGAAIYAKAITYPMLPITEAHYEKLRREMLTPDDWDITPVDVWRHARELALGFHQIWDPRPPIEWRQARREWFSFAREILSRPNGRLDSPDHVAEACDAGKLPAGFLNEWRRVRPSFTPNEVPVWHDDSALERIAQWMADEDEGPGIVWVEHVPVGLRLSEMTGAVYYGEGGWDSTKTRFILDADPSKQGSIIASRAANSEGLNLQTRWYRNLVTTPHDSCQIWEQLIGRTHRTGQLRDEVLVDVLLGCLEHSNAWRKAYSAAQAVFETTGSCLRLLQAEIDWPSESELSCGASFSGPRWA